jgi:aspartate aminotransferase
MDFMLSSLMQRFQEPETLRMAKLGRALRAQGVDVVDLSLGEPDFNTPDHIKKAAHEAIDADFSHYTPVPGIPALREAVCEKLKRDNGLVYHPDQIVVSTGAKQCIANLVLAVVDMNDEVVIPTPYWVTYSEIVKLAGGKPVLVPTTLSSGFKITPEQLRENLNEKTRLFMFSSPCNPTGAVYTKEELEALALVFQDFPNVYIMSDEIYEYIHFGRPHASIASIDALKDRVVVINGLSKGYAMTGWRVGYMASSNEIAKACEKIQGQFTSATNAIAQKAAVAALLGDMRPTEMMRQAFAQRKDIMLSLLRGIPDIPCAEPDGAFYLFPDMQTYIGKITPAGDCLTDATALCMYLLHDAHVSTVSGSAFGDSSCIRLSFANSTENIEKGMMRIQTALEKLT